VVKIYLTCRESAH